MTSDKVEYTISFDESQTAAAYEAAPLEAETSHVSVETDVDTAENALLVTVYGDGYVLPVFEAEMREVLPEDVTIECDVTIGGGN